MYDAYTEDSETFKIMLGIHDNHFNFVIMCDTGRFYLYNPSAIWH